ncbi:MAG TPA: DUF4202 domain-containing protein [Ilumatobacter sp.]|nr:DUF4202 domain-containing protein [Ilumatobacter sp.]
MSTGSDPTADTARFMNVLAAIDAANAADPSEAHGEPLALYEGRTAHQWTVRLEPLAPEAVQIAARAHHLRRWEVPRSSYPDGRNGYLRWRRDQQRRHSDDLSTLLAAHGYDDATIERTATIINKRGLGSDPDVQLFEDAVALTFLQSQLVSTRARLADDDKLVEVLRKTFAKMSERGRAAAGTIEISEAIAPLVARATGTG